MPLFKDNLISLNLPSEKRDFFASPTVPLTALAAWEGIGGGRTASGELVNERNAMAISTVYTCITILSEGIASFPCKLMRRADRGSEDATDHALYYLLSASPNDEMTAFSFWSTMVGCSALTGNAYAQIMRSATGSVESIWPLHPLKTDPIRRQDGTLAYKTTDGMKDGSYRIVDAKDVLHFPLFSMDGIKGIGPVAAARESFATARAMEKYGARFFANGAQPPSMLIRKGNNPDAKTQAEIRESWKAAHAGENQHSMGFLFGDWDVKSIGLPPEDSQFIMSRNWTRADIAAMFRIAPQYVGSLERLSNSNYTQQQLSLVIDTFRPIIVRIEQELHRKLIPSTGRNAGKLYVTFDVNERMRGDFETTTKTVALGRQWGIITANEGRRILGMNPVGPEGDILIVPVNMASAEQLPGQANTENIDEQPVPDPAAAKPEGDVTDATQK